jgi:hypothetical protein
VIQAEVEEKLAQPHLHRVLGVVHNVLPKERLGSKGGKLCNLNTVPGSTVKTSWVCVS